MSGPRRTVLVALLTFALAGALPAGAVHVPGPATDAPTTDTETSTDDATGATHPRLLFDASDVPSLRERVASGVPAEAWAKLKRKVDSYTDPTHPNYVPPELVRDPTPLANPDWQYYDGFLGQNQMPTYLKDLGLAYVISGDARYGRHAAELLVELSDGWPNWTRRELGEGDLATGYGLAFDWVHDQLTPDERATIVRRVVAELPDPADPAFENGVFFRCLDDDRPFSNNNWVAICGGGEGLMLLALEGEPGMPADLSPWLDVARQRILDHWQIYGSAGDNAEAFNYLSYAMKTAAPFVLAWQRERGEDLTTFNPGVLEVPVSAAYEQLPGQGTRFVPRNDALEPMPMMHEVLGWYLALRPDGLSAWLWDHTVGGDGDAVFTSEPVFLAHSTTANNTCTDVTKDPTRTVFCWRSPEVPAILYHQDEQALPRTSPEQALSERGRLYPEWGLVTARTGWDGGADELALVYEAKHDHPGGHFQSDLGHFSLYGYGARWAVDSGYGHNYSCSAAHEPVQGCSSGNPRIDNGRAAGHNVPLVDGDARTQADHAGLRSHGSITGFWDAAGATTVTSDLRHAYADDPATVPLAERDLVLSRADNEPALLVVTDRLQVASSPQRYHWRMHTDAANALTVVGQQVSMTAPNGARASVALSDAFGERFVRLLPWNNAVYNPFDNAPQHHVIDSRDARDLDGYQPRLGHLAVLALTPAGAAPATATRLPGCDRCNLVSVVAADGRELLVGSTSVGAIAHLRLQSDGQVAKVSLDRAETVLLDGTSLTADGRRYVHVTGGPATVLATGGEVVADGPERGVYRVWSPSDPTSVTLNGRTVAWTRAGDTIVFHGDARSTRR